MKGYCASHAARFGIAFRSQKCAASALVAGRVVVRDIQEQIGKMGEVGGPLKRPVTIHGTKAADDSKESK